MLIIKAKGLRKAFEIKILKDKAHSRLANRLNQRMVELND
jgi:hypothetical protein